MKKFYLLVVIFVVTIGALIYSNHQQQLHVYQTDVHAHDIQMNNLTLVNADDTLYLPGTYSIKSLFDEPIDRVSITLSYKGEYIYDWALSLDVQDVADDFGDTFIDHVTLDQDDVITVTIMYDKDGEEVAYDRDIPLKDILKEE